MIDAYLVLCDFAQADPSGKVHIIGGNWTVTGPEPAPQGLVLFLKGFSQEAIGTAITVRLRLEDSEGTPVRFPGPAGPQTLLIQGQIELLPNESHIAGDALNAAFTVNVSPLPLAAGGYVWIAEIDEKEVSRAEFRVRSR
jgi:hypothetical protein